MKRKWQAFAVWLSGAALALALVFGQAMPVMAAEDQTYQYTVDLTKGPVTLKAYEMSSRILKYHGFLHNPGLDERAEKDAAAFLETYFFSHTHSTVVSAATGNWYEGQNALYAILPEGTDKVIYLQVNRTAHQDGTGVSADFVDMTLLSGDQTGTVAIGSTSQMLDTAAASFYNVSRIFTIQLGN